MNALTDAERERLNTEALTNPAPNIAPLHLRPFNDGTLGLCSILGLSLFTLDAMMAAEGADEMQRSSNALRTLGFAEVNRQCHFVFFMLGHPSIEEMLRLVNQPEAYPKHVLPWLLAQRYDGALVPRMLEEWSRFMRHFLAASVKVLPRGGEDDSPKNG